MKLLDPTFCGDESWAIEDGAGRLLCFSQLRAIGIGQYRSRHGTGLGLGPFKRLRHYRARLGDLVHAGYRYELGNEINRKHSAPIIAFPLDYFVTSSKCA